MNEPYEEKLTQFWRATSPMRATRNVRVGDTLHAQLAALPRAKRRQITKQINRLKRGRGDFNEQVRSLLLKAVAA